MKKKLFLVLATLCLFAVITSAFCASAASSSDWGHIQKMGDGHYIQTYQLTGVNCQKDVYFDSSIYATSDDELGVLKVFPNRNFVVEVKKNNCSYTTYFRVYSANSDYPPGAWTKPASVNGTGSNQGAYLGQPSSTRRLTIGANCGNRGVSTTKTFTNSGYWSPDTY